MGRTINENEAARVLEAAAHALDADATPSPLWMQRTRQLAGMRKNRVAIAVLGTALLAKAVDREIDPLSLADRSGADGYSARMVAALLASRQSDLRYRLGTKGPDPLAASPWFGPGRITDIDKWHPASKPYADDLVHWLTTLPADDAFDALVAFLAVRREAFEAGARRLSLPRVDGSNVPLATIAKEISSYIERNPEDGRRGAALVAGAFAAAGREVIARAVNDPGQIDVDVLGASGVEIGIEVKQKPATEDDALAIAAGARAAGADVALLCALAPRQAPLDLERLAANADEKYRVVLDIITSVEDLFRRAIIAGNADRSQFADNLGVEVARFLDDLETSESGQAQWADLVARWAR